MAIYPFPDETPVAAAPAAKTLSPYQIRRQEIVDQVKAAIEAAGLAWTDDWRSSGAKIADPSNPDIKIELYFMDTACEIQRSYGRRNGVYNRDHRTGAVNTKSLIRAIRADLQQELDYRERRKEQRISERLRSDMATRLLGTEAALAALGISTSVSVWTGCVDVKLSLPFNVKDEQDRAKMVARLAAMAQALGLTGPLGAALTPRTLSDDDEID